jgi:hypothetical protein
MIRKNIVRIFNHCKIRYITETEYLQELGNIIKQRKILKPISDLTREFENEKRLEHEKKVTEYWNLLYDKIHHFRSGYFRMDHPHPDIRDEIIKIGKNQGYKIEFGKDTTKQVIVYFVTINDGF